MSTTLESVCLLTLAVVIEIAAAKWVVASRGLHSLRVRQKTLSQETPEERFAALLAEIEEAKRKLGLGSDARVTVAYEAGQESFWLARALSKSCHQVEVIDPVSLQVDRRGRRAKTDRLDAQSLLSGLWRWLSGERQALSMVRMPSLDDEDAREWQRARDRLTSRVRSGLDRIDKKLRTQGIWKAPGWRKALRGDELRRFDGELLGRQLRMMLLLELDAVEQAEQQLKGMLKALEHLPAQTQERIGQLESLRGIGAVSARSLSMKLFWRTFENRRQVGACVGMTGTPYNSGTMRQDQGISRQGDASLRGLLVELSWMWLRLQPDSALSQWFAQRTAGAGARGKRVMIVAVARRLVIALWRFLRDGEVPAGAVLKKPRPVRQQLAAA